jgi:hypothetical protein
MPGYDGTGPRGLGPMTGRGAGYCMLKIPPTYSGSLTGFAGLAGNPVSLPPVSSWAKAVFPHCRVCRVQRRTEQNRKACSLAQIGAPCCGREDRRGKMFRLD